MCICLKQLLSFIQNSSCNMFPKTTFTINSQWVPTEYLLQPQKYFHNECANYSDGYIVSNSQIRSTI